MNLINIVVPPSADKSENLTPEQKLEDFEYLYDVLSQSIPMIDEYEELYGYNFKDRKEMYKDLVLNTENDIEFYAAMEAMVFDIPSFHTDMVMFGSISNQNCYNSRKVSSDRKVIAYNKKYEKMLKEIVDDNDDLKYTVFSYVNGEYYYDDKLGNSELYEPYSKIVEVDGVAVDDYITSKPIGSGLFYDGDNDKPARNRLVFNDSFGDKVTVKIENKDGSITVDNLFISLLATTIWYNHNNKADKEDAVCE